MKRLNPINELTRDDMIEELLAGQKAIILKMDDHTMQHQIMRVRLGLYAEQLQREAECDAEEEDINPGQYL